MGEWNYCGQEDEFCSFEGTKNVRYGLGDVWHYEIKTDGTDCSNDVFGDPVPGFEKECYYMSGYATNPLIKDTDSDGLEDGDEVNDYETNPTNTDSDGDLIEDGAEINTYETDPNNDSDQMAMS